MILIGNGRFFRHNHRQRQHRNIAGHNRGQNMLIAIGPKANAGAIGFDESHGLAGIKPFGYQLRVNSLWFIFQMDDAGWRVSRQLVKRLAIVIDVVAFGARNRIAMRVVGGVAQPRRQRVRRFMDLGILPGTAITAEMRSPSGEPTAYRIRDAIIALRPNQANYIYVKSGD